MCQGHSVPRYYMVVEEKGHLRVPDPEKGLFLWGTSLYVIACLLCKMCGIGSQLE